jgi:hypothetical protein
MLLETVHVQLHGYTEDTLIYRLLRNVHSGQIDTTCEYKRPNLAQTTTAGRQELWIFYKWVDHVGVRSILRCKKKVVEILIYVKRNETLGKNLSMGGVGVGGVRWGTAN